MKQEKKDLLRFVLEFREELNKESMDNANILIDLLQEKSHAFGLESFANAEDMLVDNLDNIFETELFAHCFYETKFDINKTYDMLDEINFFQNTKKDKVLNLILNVLNFLLYEEKRVGKIISLLLTDHADDPAIQSFRPINDIVYWAIEELETKVFYEIHKDIIGTDVYENYLGWFYWFCFENDFGEKSLSIELNGETKKICNNYDFINLINMLT